MVKNALLILFFVVVGCSPAKRMHRLIKNHPELLTIKDTIYTVDTVKITTERVFKDSVFLISKDTVTIVKENMTIKHFINGKTVYISGECDTIYKEKIITNEIIVDKVVYKKTDFEIFIDNWGKYILLLILVFLVIALIKYFKK